MLIRLAYMDDACSIWGSIGPIIGGHGTYALDRDLTEGDALAYWLGPDRKTFVGGENGDIVSTYYSRANQPGGAKHIGNSGSMTSSAATGRGGGRAMCQHSLNYARRWLSRNTVQLRRQHRDTRRSALGITRLSNRWLSAAGVSPFMMTMGFSAPMNTPLDKPYPRGPA